MRNKIVAVIFGICMVCGGYLSAATIDVDGDFGGANEWGVDVSQPGLSNLGYFDTYLPTNATRYITEDNAYTAGDPVQYVGPAYSDGNSVDAEAMYFTYDATNIYVAVVSGLNPYTLREDIGNLFIDTGKYQTSTSYAPPVDIGVYNPLETGNIHANSHVDTRYEYALHYYDLNSTTDLNDSTDPLAITPTLYRLDQFIIDNSYPDDISNAHDIRGTTATGEPTALGADLRFGPYYQTQSEMADPWAIHYSNYMQWMNGINNGDPFPLTPLAIDAATVHALAVGGLDFGVGTVGNDHFLYEFQIPMSAIGWDPTQPLWLHWTMECGNDELDLIYAPVVPEPGTLTLLGLGLLGIGAARRKKIAA